MCGKELEFVRDAFASNWIAPLGPQVDAFEREFAEAVGVPYAAALSSGTAALHLALRILAGRQEKVKAKVEMRESSEVLCSTFTFSASANAIAYEGGVPVFIDSDAESWNMDPRLLREELAACAKQGKLPRAVIVVDLYGQCADYDPIVRACEEFQVPLIEDAAEALGATYEGKVKVKVEVKEEETGDGGRETNARSASQKAKVKYQKSKLRTDEGGEQKSELPGSTLTLTSTSTCSRPSTSTSARLTGSFGRAAAFSFNGNKIITTAGGGMLVSHDKAITDKARFLATQARDPAPYYQHSEIGFNYRMSNILAAIGRGQLTVLSERIAARRRNFEFYQQALGDLPGIEFMPEAPFGRCTRWLTCLTIGEAKVKAKAKVKPDSTSTVGEAKVKVKVEQDGGRETGEERKSKGKGQKPKVKAGDGRGQEAGLPGSTSTFTSTLIRALEAENIEARPLWKPMHLQPVFKGCRVRGGGVSERLFENGLCLPSGSALSEEDLERICAVVRRAWPRP
jgi:dTDP-4-amino-4,6-dideoxygalactose transaminase